jgi:hypothetical protein
MEIQPDSMPFVIAEDPLDFPDASFDARAFSPAPLPGERKSKGRLGTRPLAGRRLPFPALLKKPACALGNLLRLS